jgi:SAM-dependent methyltransferase
MHFEMRHTYDFIRRSLPRNCRHILEIGCGTGELAARLSQDGVAIVAIDSDPDSVAAALRLGVDARIATWPDFDDGEFDAVLFTRSLHHIHPLDESLRQAVKSLAADGRVIVEDFAHESTDEKTLRWFNSAIRFLEATRSLTLTDEFLERVLSKTATLQAWKENHDPDLHTSAAIAAQLERILGGVRTENAPYYFRYIANAISPTERRDAILQAFAEQEETLAADGSISALGRRFVATRAR